MSLSPKAFWGLLIAAGTAYEVRSLRRHDGGTASEVIRATLRTETKTGRAVFLILCAVFLMWFIPHILVIAEEVLDD